MSRSSSRVVGVAVVVLVVTMLFWGGAVLGEVGVMLEQSRLRQAQYLVKFYKATAAQHFTVDIASRLGQR